MMHKTYKSLARYAGSRVRIELRSGIKVSGVLEADAGRQRFWLGNERFSAGQVLSIDRTY